MHHTPEVLVVGGGPAGASVAFRLASAGARVVVLERARFPRPKACAECLSPQATRILHEMGALDALRDRGAWLRGMMVRSPAGVSARGDYRADHGFRAFDDRGLAIRREVLDAVLLDRAQGAGARLDAEARVTDVVRDTRGRVRGVRVIRPSGAFEEMRAPMIVGADGLRSVVARRLGLARVAVWPRRLSLVAHYAGVHAVTDYGEMHVERDGFVGIADVGGGVTTVAAVFPLRMARAIAADRDAFLRRWLEAKPHLAHRFSRATRAGRTAAIGPFASHARRAWHPGALLVGDAADFFDPFTGEGIYAALHGGELAAQAALAALGATTDAGVVRALAGYERARRRAFGGKWIVERLIGAGVAAPPIINRAARAMAGTKALADLLVGVTGDFVPPARVLNSAYLARLLLFPVPTSRSLSACQ